MFTAKVQKRETPPTWAAPGWQNMGIMGVIVVTMAPFGCVRNHGNQFAMVWGWCSMVLRITRHMTVLCAHTHLVSTHTHTHPGVHTHTHLVYTHTWCPHTHTHLVHIAGVIAVFNM